MDIDHIIGFALIALAIIIFIALRIDAAGERKRIREMRKRKADDLINFHRNLDAVEKF